MSLLTSCRTFQESRNKTRITHFPKSPEINKPIEKKELRVRTPNLNKLKIIKPQIIKSKMKEDKISFAEKMDELHRDIFDEANKDDLNQDAKIIEEEKPYSRLDMIMLWLAVLAGCTLVWCSIWFVGRTLLK